MRTASQVNPRYYKETCHKSFLILYLSPETRTKNYIRLHLRFNTFNYALSNDTEFNRPAYNIAGKQLSHTPMGQGSDWAEPKQKPRYGQALRSGVNKTCVKCNCVSPL